MMQSKWKFLAGEGYTLEDLGRPAIFLLPVKKLQQKVDKESDHLNWLRKMIGGGYLRKRGVTVEEELHRFLIEHFGAYTSSPIPNFGFWKNTEKATISDECREYKVSFLGKERIPVLLKKLAEIATIIGEECIYVEAGQYACLVHPSQESSP